MQIMIVLHGIIEIVIKKKKLVTIVIYTILLQIPFIK